MGSSRSTLPAHISAQPRTSSPTQTTTQTRTTDRHRRRSYPVGSRTVQMHRTPSINYDAIRFSDYSDPAAPDRVWFAQDFMLGAGMIVIQPSTNKVVILKEIITFRGEQVPIWFLPKGRKDVGESIEHAALREAYEESGLRVSFLPLIMPTNAPLPPNMRHTHHRLPCTEPIYVDLLRWQRRRGGRHDNGGEYLVLWYVGQIPDDAVVETGTRMPDEVGYETYLVTKEQAAQLLPPPLSLIVEVAFKLWETTQATLQSREYQEYLAHLGMDLTSLGLGPALAQVAGAGRDSVTEVRAGMSTENATHATSASL
ncbi:hypothetical protein BD414DRAFT_483461 [Trametes punicea]|nr:hypothetical protein BD414DRAFT_483461 [Trametes punicea]